MNDKTPQPNTAQQEQQQAQLKALITKGKEQGFLTYTEVNDHLPPDIVDPEQVEDIIAMINDMGIQVFETAPDADTLLLAANTESTAADDEDATEEATQVLVSLDAEFGRTTDPVRMYMREMGSVELLTRQGEIVIAKRIEEGKYEILSCFADYPGCVARLLDRYSKVASEEVRLSDIISGFRDTMAAVVEPEIPLEEPEDIEALAEVEVEAEEAPAEEVAETGPDPILAAQRFAELQESYEKYLKSAEKNGRTHKSAQKLLGEVSALFLQFNFTARQLDLFGDQIRDMLEDVRSQERLITRLCVQKAKMPRKDFIASFPKHETDMTWLEDVSKR